MKENRFDVFTITDRERDGKTASYWLKVGVAFRNKDGSLNVYLDALPVNGRLQLREPNGREADDAADGK
jgi:hypothetical protein